MEKDAFRTVVKEGARKPAGMPSYPQISDEDVEAIRYYLRLRAKQAPAELAALKKGSRPASRPPSQASRTGN